VRTMKEAKPGSFALDELVLLCVPLQFFDSVVDSVGNLPTVYNAGAVLALLPVLFDP
jgi:hypothetical protein